MHKRPLAAICIFFIIGIVLARFLPPSIKFLHILIVTLVFVLLSFIFSKYQKISVALVFFSVTSFAAFLYFNSNIYSSNHISSLLKDEKLKTPVIGVIRSPALIRKPYYGKISSTYLFELEAIKRTSTQENLWLKTRGLAQIRIQMEKDYRYGDRLLVNGTIRKPALPKEKDDFNYREHLERQNIFALISTKENNVTVLSRNHKSNPILKHVYSIREKLKNRTIEKMPLESGAFLRAILLGDRSELPKHIQTSFRDSGTMHILAISGLHVGLIALVIMYLLKLLRIKREICYISTIIFLIFFAIFTLSRPSVVRAVVMVCVFLIGMLLGRKVDIYNSLGTAALFVLIRNPKDLFNIGFQLSFIAVLSIVFFVPKFKRVIREDSNIFVRRLIYMPAAVSISAWIGTFPLILYYFKMVVPIAIVANVVILPVLFVLLIGSMTFLMFGWVPFVSTFLAGFNNVFASIIFSLTDFFASLKFGHYYLG